MEKITIQDVRNAIREVAKNRQTNDLLENLNDDELIESSVDENLCMISGQMEGIIRQLSQDRHLHLPRELHKVLPNNIIKSIVDTVNLYIEEEEKMEIRLENGAL